MFKWFWNSLIQHLTLICYLSMGHIVFKYCKLQHFCIYILCYINMCNTCIWSRCNMQTSILLDFTDVFCMYVDFYLLSFRHFNAGPMALPTDDMGQCHSYVGQYMKVDTVVIPLPNIPLVLIF